MNYIVVRDIDKNPLHNLILSSVYRKNIVDSCCYKCFVSLFRVVLRESI